MYGFNESKLVAISPIQLYYITSIVTGFSKVIHGDGFFYNSPFHLLRMLTSYKPSCIVSVMVFGILTNADPVSPKMANNTISVSACHYK